MSAQPNLIAEFCQDESAQGIAEYGAIIAFISILVAITFSTSNGVLMPAVSKAYSAVASQINQLSSSAAAASS